MMEQKKKPPKLYTSILILANKILPERKVKSYGKTILVQQMKQPQKQVGKKL